MQTAVETINSYSKKLKVEIDSSDLTPIQQKIIKSYQRSAKIPGFRPGKAPLNMVQKKYKDEIQ
ncbi:MAG: trigger factor family protein, partial [Calditrichia bacterium]